MKSKNESQRKHARWYFWSPEEPFSTQTNGLAVEVLRVSLFKRRLGHGVIKDISLGGAGILISKGAKVPDKIIILTQNKQKYLADVVYQRKEGEFFLFLGITWADNKDDDRLELINQVRSITNAENRV